MENSSIKGLGDHIKLCLNKTKGFALLFCQPKEGSYIIVEGRAIHIKLS